MRPPTGQSITAQRRSPAVGDHLSARAQALERAPQVVSTADTIEDDVNAIARQAKNLFREIDVVVVDRGCTQAGHQLALGSGGRPVHFQIDKPSQLEQGRAYAACSSVDQHALARFYPRGAAHHLVRRGVVEDHDESFCRVEPCRNGNQFLLWQADELGICTPHWQGSNHLSWFQRVCANTWFVNYPDKIPPWR